MHILYQERLFRLLITVKRDKGLQFSVHFLIGDINENSDLEITQISVKAYLKTVWRRG